MYFNNNGCVVQRTRFRKKLCVCPVASSIPGTALKTSPATATPTREQILPSVLSIECARCPWVWKDGKCKRMMLYINYSSAYAEDQMVVTVYKLRTVTWAMEPFCYKDPLGITRDRHRKSQGFSGICCQGFPCPDWVKSPSPPQKKIPWNGLFLARINFRSSSMSRRPRAKINVESCQESGWEKVSGAI